MTVVEAFAPAKINLALHVIGQRKDGYHLLDSIVAFADYGDTVVVRPSGSLCLTIEGPFGQGLEPDGNNLVLRAARFLDPARTAEITLVKRLPVASGIGGGSADAAAALRALSVLWSVPLPPAETCAALGADVPVCLDPVFSRMSGIGDKITPLGNAPDLDIVLINPGVAVPTSAIFKGLARKDNVPMSATVPASGSGRWLDWLHDQRNDLEAPAIAAERVIAEVLEELRGMPACRLARMSGSGATCFALFERGRTPLSAVEAIKARHPEWWVTPTQLTLEQPSVKTL